MYLTAWSLTDQFLLYSGWALLVAGSILGVMIWRLKHRRVYRSTATPSIRPGQSASRPPVLKGIDLQLLWFMSDERPEALPAEIERYLGAFETDLQSTHSAVLNRSAREIHRGAHRLVAHSAAINYEPLLSLATKLQSEASTLNTDQLDQLMSAFDLRFTELKKTLGAIRVSTGHG